MGKSRLQSAGQRVIGACDGSQTFGKVVAWHCFGGAGANEQNWSGGDLSATATGSTPVELFDVLPYSDVQQSGLLHIISESEAREKALTQHQIEKFYQAHPDQLALSTIFFFEKEGRVWVARVCPNYCGSGERRTDILEFTDFIVGRDERVADSLPGLDTRLVLRLQ